MSQSSNLRCWYILLWVLDGWWHGTVIYYVCFYVMSGGMVYSEASFSLPGTSYAATDYNMFGNACFIYVVVTVTMRIVVTSRTLNLIIILGLFITGFRKEITPCFIQTAGDHILIHLLLNMKIRKPSNLANCQIWFLFKRLNGSCGNTWTFLNCRLPVN
ncbi:hypothetical protein ACTXT7_007109 [Hymenolepis weldensis]